MTDHWLDDDSLTDEEVLARFMALTAVEVVAPEPQSDANRKSAGARGTKAGRTRRSSTGSKGRFVIPNKQRGGWDVVKPDHERASAHFATQAEAIERAREIVAKADHGEVLVIRTPKGDIEVRIQKVSEPGNPVPKTEKKPSSRRTKSSFS